MCRFTGFKLDVKASPPLTPWDVVMIKHYIGVDQERVPLREVIEANNTVEKMALALFGVPFDEMEEKLMDEGRRDIAELFRGVS